uniref:Uncharacterized protein n=1 Tax=Physcomitrium patens TaxID=3218 RepID=A0A2K1JJ11_PHYPA|nr:hypothetical protein PHYPA_018719 [Physcomitrium patens]
MKVMTSILSGIRNASHLLRTTIVLAIVLMWYMLSSMRQASRGSITSITKMRRPGCRDSTSNDDARCHLRRRRSMSRGFLLVVDDEATIGGVEVSLLSTRSGPGVEEPVVAEAVSISFV